MSQLLAQLFRNRISRSRKLSDKIQRIESVIIHNYSKKEQTIVSEIVKEWNSDRIIDLPPILLNGTYYDLWLEFCQLFTHGKPYVTITSKVEIEENDFIEYETEFGDIAILVEYLFENFRLDCKISVLQTKKETMPNQSEIRLHQLYLMWFWPSVSFKKNNFRFKGVASEEFSFYHFILDKSRHSMYSSSICSSPFVGVKLGLTKPSLVTQLKHWVAQRKAGRKKPPPSLIFKGVLPGAVANPNASRRNSWSMVPKPFGRFLREAAYLFVGTRNDEVLELAKLRIPNVLLLRVRAAREKGRWLDVKRSDLRN